MSLINRYSNTLQGGMVFTGNTVGLNGTSITTDCIAVFTSLNTSLQVEGGYPKGTTKIINKNGSSAKLVLPTGSKIVYAELIWSGTYKLTDIDISGVVDNQIVFITPDGKTHKIVGDIATEQKINSSLYVDIYTHSCNVTDILKDQHSGTYSVKQIPAAISVIDTKSAFCGWTLAVVYEDETMDFNNINLYLGAISITANKSKEYDITGFKTVGSLPISAKLFVSTGEGDCNRIGESVYFGKDKSSLTKISGPNNAEDNFFASQINGSDGLLDRSGSFGHLNQTPGQPTAFGLRQGYDITTVDVSSHIEEGQTAAIIKLSSTDDHYIVNALGLTIEGQPYSAYLTHNLDVDKKVAKVGDILTYTHTLTNTSIQNLTNLFFRDIAPSGTEFVPGSVTLDGTSLPSIDAEDGFAINMLKAGKSKTIVLQVKIKENNNKMIQNTANTSYQYELPDGTTKTDNQDSNLIETTNLTESFTKVKSSNETFLTAGEKATQTVTLTNDSDYTITDITFTDTLTGSATYVTGSVTVNGTAYPIYDLTTGFTVPDIAANGSAIITYEIVADDTITSTTITNIAQVVYTVDDPTAGSTQYTENTNIVTLDAYTGNLDVAKTANRDTVNSGAEIEYTVVVTNNEQLDKTNLNFTDADPAGTTFKTGSVVIDGVSQPTYDPNTGFALKDLANGESTTVVFTVTVN